MTVNPKEFYAAHRRCPNCKGDHVDQTLVGVMHDPGKDFVDNMNIACCKERECGWTGKVSELLPPKVSTKPYRHASCDCGECHDKDMEP
jgi:hypothetical protein